MSGWGFQRIFHANCLQKQGTKQNSRVIFAFEMDKFDKQYGDRNVISEIRTLLKRIIHSPRFNLVFGIRLRK